MNQFYLGPGVYSSLWLALLWAVPWLPVWIVVSLLLSLGRAGPPAADGVRGMNLPQQTAPVPCLRSLVRLLRPGGGRNSWLSGTRVLPSLVQRPALLLPLSWEKPRLWRWEGNPQRAPLPLPGALSLGTQQQGWEHGSGHPPLSPGMGPMEEEEEKPQAQRGRLRDAAKARVPPALRALNFCPDQAPAKPRPSRPVPSCRGCAGQEEAEAGGAPCPRWSPGAPPRHPAGAGQAVAVLRLSGPLRLSPAFLPSSSGDRRFLGAGSRGASTQ